MISECAVDLKLTPLKHALTGIVSLRDPQAIAVRTEGKDWPPMAVTMIGLKRLDNLERCIVDVVQRDVPGDLLEAGVWRGGACIFMRAVLKALGDTERKVWVADSFQGLPRPDPASYPVDAGDPHWTYRELVVPLLTVQKNFEKFNLLDEQVRFLPGWFRDTLPTAPVERLAVLRLDGDMYESTMVTLASLYPKVSPGGYVIIDDYVLPRCKQAVEDFRSQFGITAAIRPIDWTGVFWQV